MVWLLDKLGAMRGGIGLLMEFVGLMVGVLVGYSVAVVWWSTLLSFHT